MMCVHMYVCDTACACKVRSKDFNHEYANAHLLNIIEIIQERILYSLSRTWYGIQHVMYVQLFSP